MARSGCAATTTPQAIRGPPELPSHRAQGVRRRWRARSRHRGLGMQQHAVGGLGAIVERARIGIDDDAAGVAGREGHVRGCRR